MIVSQQQRNEQARTFFGKDSALLLLLAVAVFGLTYFSTVNTASSDPRFTLLVSQSIIENQAIKLDHYEQLLGAHHRLNGNYRVKKIGGHYYYYYPLATSLISVPFVWVANLAGRNMTIENDELAAQNLISAILSALIVVLLYLICRCYAEPAAAFSIAGVSFLGSSLISTLGTALWSTDTFVLFNALGLWYIARFEQDRIKQLNPYYL
ncbi:MAG: hypothetical protein D6768_00860, partial [Chloroflexi bacterium]